jgi:hypothetical protein
MKADPILQKAARLAGAGKYQDAIRTLEPEVNRYYGSFRYYYLLGVSCLYSGDFGGALTYFRLAREVKIRDPFAMLGLAALYLRRGETGKAVDFYLDVREMDPKNKTAGKALKVIRKYSQPDAFNAWLESGKLRGLYPPIPFAGFSPRTVISCAAIIMAAAVISLGALVKLRIVPNPFARQGVRPISAEFNLTREERQESVQSGGVYRYIVTRTEALDTYDRALSLFTAYRDEAAKIQLNRILESNAADTIKNKARILLGYMEVPGFDNFRRADNIPYAEVKKDPVLYRNVHIIWRGMATNVITVDSRTTFDFLVGYDTRKTLEGIIPVVFEKAISINNERPLEVLGKILPLNNGVDVLSGGGIELEGVAIYQSGTLENK